MPTELADPRPQLSGTQATERNRLLRALPTSAYARVMDELELLDLPFKQVLGPDGGRGEVAEEGLDPILARSRGGARSPSVGGGVL
jgi:hypothetical protein